MGTGRLLGPHRVHRLAAWRCPLWDSVESCAFLSTVVPKHEAAAAAEAQPAAIRGDFDTCNVCFICSSRTGLSLGMTPFL